MSILTELDLTRMESDSYSGRSRSWAYPPGIDGPMRGLRERELIRLARLGMKYEQEQDDYDQERSGNETVCEFCGEPLICELCDED